MKNHQLADVLGYFATEAGGIPRTVYSKAKSPLMDKHDLMILDIVQQHKKEMQEHIRLSALERNFWKRIEGDVTLSVGQARIGERITRLYLDGMIQNKSGYMLTKKGREALSLEGERLTLMV